MFEKEVLEIAKDIYIHHFDDDVKYPDVLNAIIRGTQRGAELGFGWHKITDWEDNSQFPRDELANYLVRLYQDHYVVCEVSVSPEGYREFWLVDNLEPVDPQDVIAWCEIPGD